MKIEKIKKEVRNLLNHKIIYDSSFSEKKKLNIFNLIVSHHYKNCAIYKKFIDNTLGKLRIFKNIEDIPYLPASIFKQLDLFSIKKKKIV